MKNPSLESLSTLSEAPIELELDRKRDSVCMCESVCVFVEVLLPFVRFPFGGRIFHPELGNHPSSFASSTCNGGGRSELPGQGLGRS
jgi:hypothetical protein